MVSHEEVTLVDALAKVRELKEALSDQEMRHAIEVDALRDEISELRERHVSELKKVHETAREREAEWQTHKQEYVANLKISIRSEFDDKIEKLTSDLSTKVAAFEYLQNNIEDEAADVNSRIVEIDFLKNSLLLEKEESVALRQALDRERHLLASERASWEKQRTELLDDIQEFKQRSSKAELNSRWVDSVQKSLQAKTTNLRVSSIASEVLLELLEAVRLTIGRMQTDAIINKAMRTLPSVERATNSGVNIPVILSSTLSSFSKERAVANAQLSKAEDSSDPSTDAMLQISCRTPAAPVVFAQRQLLARAKQLQMEAETLSRPDDDDDQFVFEMPEP